MVQSTPDNSVSRQDRRDIIGLFKTAAVMLVGFGGGAATGFGLELIGRAHGVEIGTPGTVTGVFAAGGAILTGAYAAIAEGISRIRR